MSLMDLASDDDVVINNTSETTGQGEKGETDSKPEPSWYLDKERPMDGDRPEWLPSKFKTIQDLAQSYKHLESKFGQVPDDYNLTKADLYFDSSDEAFQGLKEVLKEKRISQDAVDVVMDAVNMYMLDFDIDMGKEREALGENANERIKTLNNWAKSNLSEEAYKGLASSLYTAESIKALEEIRNKMIGDNTMVPTDNTNAGETGFTTDDVQKEIANNFDRYQKEPAYRRELENKMASAIERDGKYRDKSFNV